MAIEKQVTIMTDISQRETQNAKVISADMTLDILYDCFPDLTEGKFKTLFEDKRVKHVVICIYENLKGESKRRMGGLHKKANGKEEIMDVVKDVAHSLGIDITRSLELIRP